MKVKFPRRNHATCELVVEKIVHFAVFGYPLWEEQMPKYVQVDVSYDSLTAF